MNISNFSIKFGHVNGSFGEESFIELTLLIIFLYKQKIFQFWWSHFEKWRNEQFHSYFTFQNIVFGSSHFFWDSLKTNLTQTQWELCSFFQKWLNINMSVALPGSGTKFPSSISLGVRSLSLPSFNMQRIIMI